MSATIQDYALQLLQEDLGAGADKFWIRYRDDDDQEQKIYYWLPSPLDLCEAPQITERGGRTGLLVTTETLDQPNGPTDDPAFAQRAGVPGMTSPGEYGARAVQTWIPLERLIVLRLRPEFTVRQRILWLLDPDGNLFSIETVCPPDPVCWRTRDDSF